MTGVFFFDIKLFHHFGHDPTTSKKKARQKKKKKKGQGGCHGWVWVYLIWLSVTGCSRMGLEMKLQRVLNRMG